MIDSHCHLDFEVFDEDRGEVLKRAQEAGVGRMILAGCWPDAARREGAAALVRAHPEQLSLVSGVHPHEVDSCHEDALQQVEALAASGQLVGLGETGLDFFHDLSDRDNQRQWFRRWLRLARRLELPVVIHTRNADDDTVRILEEEGLPSCGGVIHCFSSSRELALAALEMGMYLGVTGMVSFRWADELRSILRDVPLERLLIETDAPYLAPVPRRGKRNEPAYVRYVCAALADVLELDGQDVARETEANARRLFSLS